MNDRPTFANLDEIDVYYFTFPNANVKLWGLNATVWNHVNLPCTCSNFEGYKDPKNSHFFDPILFPCPTLFLTQSLSPKFRLQATRGADIEFSSDVCKKEKVSLAARDKVGHAGLVVFGCLSTGDRACKFWWFYTAHPCNVLICSQ
jgi:hypothetical protein